MTSSCAVYGCKNVACKGSDLHFFKFPKSETLRKKWIEKCRRKDKFNWKTNTICSDHFLDSDFDNLMQYRLMNHNLRLRLKKGIIPSQNLKGNKKSQPLSERTSRYEENARKAFVEQIMKDANEDLSYKLQPVEGAKGSVVSALKSAIEQKRNRVVFDNVPQSSPSRFNGKKMLSDKAIHHAVDNVGNKQVEVVTITEELKNSESSSNKSFISKKRHGDEISSKKYRGEENLVAVPILVTVKEESIPEIKTEPMNEDDEEEEEAEVCHTEPLLSKKEDVMSQMLEVVLTESEASAEIYRELEVERLKERINQLEATTSTLTTENRSLKSRNKFLEEEVRQLRIIIGEKCENFTPVYGAKAVIKF